MLLRASRAAGQLTKEAIVGSLAAKGAKAILGSAGKHWKGIAGTSLVGLMVAPEISQGVQRSQVGLSKPWLRATNAGQVPSIPE